jgi:hypothetical protein
MERVNAMSEADKIVAAILAVGLATKDRAVGDATRFVEKYQEVLRALEVSRLADSIRETKETIRQGGEAVRGSESA